MIEEIQKRVHKAEFRWILGAVVAGVVLGGGVIWAGKASVDKVDGMQRQIDRIDYTLQRFDSKLDDIPKLDDIRVLIEKNRNR
jgi:hypothetical protein